MNILAQIPTEVPITVNALLWVIILVLGGSVATLFWQLQKEKDRSAEFKVELIERTTLAIAEVDRSLIDVTAILGELDKDLRLQRQIQELREVLTQRNGK